MKKGKLMAKQENAGWIFVAPFLVGFLLIYLPVFIDSIVYSFSNIVQGDEGFVLENVGWKNYDYILFSSSEFVQELVNSVLPLIPNVLMIVIFSLFIAVMLNQKMKFRGVYRVVFFMPVILAVGVIAEAEVGNRIVSGMWETGGIDTGVAGGSGLINSLDIQKYLSYVNISPEFTSAITSAVNNIYGIINSSGVQILIFLAGLQSISPSVYEAAYVEGASGWEVFWKITFPMISPIMYLNIIYTIIDGFTNGNNGLITLIGDVGIKQAKYGIGSAMAWVYTIITVVLLALVMLILGKMQRTERRH